MIYILSSNTGVIRIFSGLKLGVKKFSIFFLNSFIFCYNLLILILYY